MLSTIAVLQVVQSRRSQALNQIGLAVLCNTDSGCTFNRSRALNSLVTLLNVNRFRPILSLPLSTSSNFLVATFDYWPLTLVTAPLFFSASNTPRTFDFHVSNRIFNAVHSFIPNCLAAHRSTITTLRS